MIASSILSPPHALSANRQCRLKDNTAISSAAANINHHGAGRLSNRQSGTNGCRHGLFNQKYAARTADMALSMARRSTAVAPDGNKPQSGLADRRLCADKVLNHFFRHVKIAITHHALGEWL